MEFEWDARKSKANLEKHGIRFEDASLIFGGIVFTAVDKRENYGEERKISIGGIGDIIIIVVMHTDRRGKIRIISARRANSRERSKYHEFCKNFKEKNRWPEKAG